MPKYTFECSDCDYIVQRIVPVKTKTLHCKCGKEMKRRLPVLAGSTQVNEVVDKTTGKRWKQDQTEILEERKEDYYWSIEVPRMVNSGKYSIETMLEMGWIYFDDKEDIKVRTKSPQKD